MWYWHGTSGGILPITSLSPSLFPLISSTLPLLIYTLSRRPFFFLSFLLLLLSSYSPPPPLFLLFLLLPSLLSFSSFLPPPIHSFMQLMSSRMSCDATGSWSYPTGAPCLLLLTSFRASACTVILWVTHARTRTVSLISFTSTLVLSFVHNYCPLFMCSCILSLSLAPVKC